MATRARDGNREESGRLVLFVLGHELIARHALPASGTVTLGRSDENDIQLDDPSVSRRHAAVHVGPPLRIEDLGSSNGIGIRRRRGDGRSTAQVVEHRLHVGEFAELAPGDQIMLGSTSVVIRTATPGEVRGGGPGEAGAGGEERVIVADAAMKELYRVVARIAAAPLSVLLLGETGAGKDEVAQALHRGSPRAPRRFLRVNCAALPEPLLESELFGHERGAFTGAAQPKPGLLETAEGGTVFLDEIGELPLPLQAKLLHAVESRQVTRVGGLKPRAIDVRFVAATNRDLAAEAERGTFRRDLFYRLSGMILSIPPLRDRPADILPLAERFVAITCAAAGRPPLPLSSGARELLARHRWPGNVRELRNAIERAVLLCSDDAIGPGELLLLDAGAASPAPVPAPPEARAEAGTDLRGELDSLEQERILGALERCGGNQSEAARQLGMPRRTLLKRLDSYGVTRPRKGRPG